MTLCPANLEANNYLTHKNLIHPITNSIFHRYDSRFDNDSKDEHGMSASCWTCHVRFPSTSLRQGAISAVPNGQDLRQNVLNRYTFPCQIPFPTQEQATVHTGIYSNMASTARKSAANVLGQSRRIFSTICRARVGIISHIFFRRLARRIPSTCRDPPPLDKTDITTHERTLERARSPLCPSVWAAGNKASTEMGSWTSTAWRRRRARVLYRMSVL